MNATVICDGGLAASVNSIGKINVLTNQDIIPSTVLVVPPQLLENRFYSIRSFTIICAIKHIDHKF